MARGHKTGGRQKGTPNKATVRLAAKLAEAAERATAGLSPSEIAVDRQHEHRAGDASRGHRMHKLPLCHRVEHHGEEVSDLHTHRRDVELRADRIRSRSWNLARSWRTSGLAQHWQWPSSTRTPTSRIGVAITRPSSGHRTTSKHRASRKRDGLRARSRLRWRQSAWRRG